MSCLPALFPGRAAAPVAPEPPLRFATLADFAVERIIGIGGFGACQALSRQASLGPPSGSHTKLESA